MPPPPLSQLQTKDHSHKELHLRQLKQLQTDQRAETNHHLRPQLQVDRPTRDKLHPQAMISQSSIPHIHHTETEALIEKTLAHPAATAENPAGTKDGTDTAALSAATVNLII